MGNHKGYEYVATVKQQQQLILLIDQLVCQSVTETTKSIKIVETDEA